jgi:plasmid segregation protein ParM
VLKEYIKALNNGLDGYNIEFFEDEKESIWMMANAYYKLISDFVRKNTKVNEPEKQSVKN